MTKAKKQGIKLIIAVVALVLAIVMTVSMCIAWFYYNHKIDNTIGFAVVKRPFSLGYIKVTVGDQLLDINEFTGLLPGDEFKFEIEIEREVSGDFEFYVEFLGIRGDDFVGKTDGITYNMTEMFCVAPIKDDPQDVAQAKFFSDAEGGRLKLDESYSMPDEVDSVLIRFRIYFVATKVPQNQLPPDISKKVFDIGNIYII